MYFEKVTGFSKAGQLEYERFLNARGLRSESSGGITVLCRGEDDRLLACASLDKNLIKQVAVDESVEGGGLCASILSEVIQIAAEAGTTHLFLCTKPQNVRLFSSVGFYTIIETDCIALMENQKNGIGKFLASCPRGAGTTGAVVCACNPFTLGHRALIDHASSRCDRLLVFVLESEGFLFSARERFEMVKRGTADIPNVSVIQSSDYLISPALFPTYFIKEQKNIPAVQCELDIELFCRVIAPALNITKRFVGTEPFDPVTAEYNRLLKERCPKAGIELCEVERFRSISGTKIRQAIAEGRLEEVRDQLPVSTYEICRSKSI